MMQASFLAYTSLLPRQRGCLAHALVTKAIPLGLLNIKVFQLWLRSRFFTPTDMLFRDMLDD